MTHRFPLALSSWDSSEIAAMQSIIASGRFTMGEYVARFEAEFAAAVGSRYAVMVNSGSSANLLMIAALTLTRDPARRLSPGDEVIVPAVSWSTTYYPVHQYGLKMKFVDVDLGTLNFDLERLREAITPRTRLVFAVNLLGNPNRFDVVSELCSQNGSLLIEDNCESLGAKFAGKQAGTFGLMGSFSCFFSHHISTMEGGVVCTDDEELHHLLLSLRAHGWTRNLPQVNHVVGRKKEDPFEESYRFVLPGYNVRPLELSGAVGIEQVRKIPDFIAQRRTNAAKFVEVVGRHPGVLVQEEIGESSWFGFSLIAKPGSGLTRRRIRAWLEDMGFECRPIVAGNFAKNEVMKYFAAEVPESLPNAEHLDSNGLFIGNHHVPMEEAFAVLAENLDRLG